MTETSQQRGLSVWQFLMLFLSLYVLVALLAEKVFTLPAEVSRLLSAVDMVVCAVFAADFFIQLTVVDSVTKKLDMLIVADPNTQSTKAKKARQYGIRIIHESEFWRMLGVATE